MLTSIDFLCSISFPKTPRFGDSPKNAFIFGEIPKSTILLELYFAFFFQKHQIKQVSKNLFPKNLLKTLSQKHGFQNMICHRVNSFIFQRANPHILSPYPFHSLFRTLSLFSPIIIIALWNLTGRDFSRHFPLIFTSFPRPFPGYSHTLPTHFHWFSLALPWPFFLFHSSHCSHSFLVS